MQAAIATSKSRVALLNERVSAFNRAMYWSDQIKLANMVTAKVRPEIGRRLKARRKTENLVDMEVQNIELDAENMNAEVEMLTRFFKVSHNVVKERIEKQTWAFFRFEGGWKLTDIEQISEEGASL